jgi:hypothetical protein
MSMYRIYWTINGILGRYRHCKGVSVHTEAELLQQYGAYEDMHFVLIGHTLREMGVHEQATSFPHERHPRGAIP